MATDRDQGFWLDYPNATGVRFRLRPLSAGEMKKLFKLGRSEGAVTYLLDHMVTDWKGIEIDVGEHTKKEIREASLRAFLRNEPLVTWLSDRFVDILWNQNYFLQKKAAGFEMFLFRTGRA